MARMPAAGRSLAILLAIALAAVATFAIWVYVNSADERAREDYELVNVVRATGLIRAGTPIATASTLMEPSEELAYLVPDDAIASLAPQALADEGLSELVVRSDILPGDVITRQRFASAAESAKNFEVPKDRIAISAQVSVVQGVAGFVNVGDHVSVIAHCDVEEETDPETGEPVAGAEGQTNSVTGFVIEDIEVLALGQRVRVTTETGGTSSSVQQNNEAVLSTLAVSELGALKLVHALNECVLHYVLLPEGYEIPVPPVGPILDVNVFLPEPS